MSQQHATHASAGNQANNSATTTSDTEYVQKVASLMREGRDRLWINTRLVNKLNGLGDPNPKEHARAILDSVEVLLREEAELKRQAELEAFLRDTESRLAEMAERLDDHGYLGEGMLDRVTAAIQSIVSPAQLETFNKQLRQKGRSLAFRDIAFCAIVHRQSILENSGEAPFKRIVKMSERSGLLSSPLDNRQIRYALGILQALKFTRELSAAARGSYDKTTHRYRKGKAGCWELVPSDFWQGVFAEQADRS